MVKSAEKEITGKGVHGVTLGGRHLPILPISPTSKPCQSSQGAQGPISPPSVLPFPNLLFHLARAKEMAPVSLPFFCRGCPGRGKILLELHR